MTIKHDYTALDAAILEALKAKPLSFTNLQSGDVQREAAQISNNDPYFSSAQFLDRRLQSLRKRAKIRHNGRAWQLRDF